MSAISLRIILICLIFSTEQISSTLSFGYVDIKELIKFGHDVVMEGFQALELIRPSDPEYDNHLPFIHRMEKELKSRISIVSQKIDTFQQEMGIQLDTVVTTLLRDIPVQERLDEKLRMVDQIVGQINDLYSNFDMYSKTPYRYEKYTLEDFAKTCVSSRSDALPDLLKRIHRFFVPSSDEILSRSILILLANQMQVSNRKFFNILLAFVFSWYEHSYTRC